MNYHDWRSLFQYLLINNSTQAISSSSPRDRKSVGIDWANYGRKSKREQMKLSRTEPLFTGRLLRGSHKNRLLSEIRRTFSETILWAKHFIGFTCWRCESIKSNEEDSFGHFAMLLALWKTSQTTKSTLYWIWAVEKDRSRDFPPSLSPEVCFSSLLLFLNTV